MTPLPPDIESLLDAERTIEAQPSEVRQRAFARARGAMTAGAGAKVAARRMPRLFGFRLLVAAALVLGVASLAGAALQIRRALVARREAARLTDVTAAASDPKSARPRDEVLTPVAEATTAEATSAPSATQPRVMTAAESYARELRLLEPARRALARDEFGAVLAAVAEHERKFPNGRLAEERDALRVRALVGQHRGDEARRAADSFRKTFPKSVLLSGIGEKP